MLFIAERLFRLAFLLWPLLACWFAWRLGAAIGEGSVYYRTAQVGMVALLFPPAFALTALQLAPRWLAFAAGAAAMIAGAAGFYDEYQRLWPYLASSGQPIWSLASYADYPLLLVSSAALLAPGALPLLRWRRYHASGRERGGLLGSARWMAMREALRVFARGDLVLGEAREPDRRPELGGKAPLLRSDGASHLLTVAGAGSGKTTSVAVPNCLTWQGSLVVHDPKGELHRICGPARRAMGREVYVLDPADPASDSLNVLDWLDPGSEELIEDARTVIGWLGDGTPPEGENKIFEENARELILTLLLLVVCNPELAEHERTLEGVRDFFAAPDLRELLAKIGESNPDLAFGVPARNARTFQAYGERFWGSVVGSAKELLNCISGPRMARLVSGAGRGRRLRTGALASGKVDVFIAVPIEVLDTNPAIARLLLGALLNAAYRSGARRPGQRILFLLDEMPRLRFMALLETARDSGRGRGITLWAIVQDLGQLERYYRKEGLRSWLENSRIKTFFGISEYETAELLSKMLGEETITVRSRAWEKPFALFSSKSDAPQARALMTPDEIMRMRVDDKGLPDEQIVLLRSHPPLRCGLAKYYRRDEFRRLPA